MNGLNGQEEWKIQIVSMYSSIVSNSPARFCNYVLDCCQMTLLTESPSLNLCTEVQKQKKTRWYRWGIQRLVSTYSNCHWWRGVCSGEGKIWTQERKLDFGGWGVFWKRSDLNTGKKIRVWKFGGVSGKSKTTQSAKVWLNFHFQGGGGVLESQNPKYQDLPKFPFWGVGCSGKGQIWTREIKGRVWKLGGGVFWKVKTNPKC